MCPEGGTRIRRAISDRNHLRVSHSLWHLRGTFLHHEYPGLQPRLREAYVAAQHSDMSGRKRRSGAKEAWAELYCPFGFGAQTLYPSLGLSPPHPTTDHARAHPYLDRTAERLGSIIFPVAY
jgi:hypothetical protein